MHVLHYQESIPKSLVLTIENILVQMNLCWIFVDDNLAFYSNFLHYHPHLVLHYNVTWCDTWFIHCDRSDAVVMASIHCVGTDTWNQIRPLNRA